MEIHGELHLPAVRHRPFVSVLVVLGANGPAVHSRVEGFLRDKHVGVAKDVGNARARLLPAPVTVDELERLISLAVALRSL